MRICIYSHEMGRGHLNQIDSNQNFMDFLFALFQLPTFANRIRNIEYRCWHWHLWICSINFICSNVYYRSIDMVVACYNLFGKFFLHRLLSKSKHRTLLLFINRTYKRYYLVFVVILIDAIAAAVAATHHTLILRFNFKLSAVPYIEWAHTRAHSIA